MTYPLILKPLKDWKDNRGMTLLEILVAVAVISILISIAAWSGQGMWENYRVRGAAREIYGDLQMARLNSIKDGKVWGVEFIDNTRYCVKNRVGVNWDSGCDLPTEDTVDIIVKTVNLATDYPGVNAGPICGVADDRVEFNPNGRAVCGGNIVTLSNATRAISLNINTGTGNIRVM